MNVDLSFFSVGFQTPCWNRYAFEQKTLVSRNVIMSRVMCLKTKWRRTSLWIHAMWGVWLEWRLGDSLGISDRVTKAKSSCNNAFVTNIEAGATKPQRERKSTASFAKRSIINLTSFQLKVSYLYRWWDECGFKSLFSKKLKHPAGDTEPERS